MDSTIKLLADLVAIDSVNPSLVPGGAGEQKIARAIAAEMRASGLEVEVTDVAPGRPNVVGVLEGRAPGRSLMLCGHMDTVGVAGMKSPFDPVVRDGCLYGRGAQDMKGGVAAMIGAARVLAQGGGLASGRLIVAAVADEECASLGAERWSAAGARTEPWSRSQPAWRSLPRTRDFPGLRSRQPGARLMAVGRARGVTPFSTWVECWPAWKRWIASCSRGPRILCWEPLRCTPR